MCLPKQENYPSSGFAGFSSLPHRLPNRIQIAHLGLKRVVLLAEVLFPEVMGVDSAPVPPLEHLVIRDIDVLEVLVLAVALGSHWNMRLVVGIVAQSVVRIRQAHREGHATRPEGENLLKMFSCHLELEVEKSL